MQNDKSRRFGQNLGIYNESGFTCQDKKQLYLVVMGSLMPLCGIPEIYVRIQKSEAGMNYFQYFMLLNSVWAV
jgi:hypothetical protein